MTVTCDRFYQDMEESLKDNLSGFEVTCILDDEDVSPLLKLIERYKGKAARVSTPVKIKLEYPINKKSFGFLFVILSELPPESIKKIRSDFSLISTCIRFMIVQKNLDKAFVTAEKQEKARSAPFNNTSRSSEAENREQRPNVLGFGLSNEALEKKIEEILR